jgi:aspartyl-tRNA(Asn)/glutamyl-tRNA(Gln) amidotransferase subunit A
MATPLCDLSVNELVQGFQTKAISPVEVAKSCFDRMDEWEGKINAMYLIQRNQALTQAKQSEVRWARGEALCAIDGVPVTLKENLHTAGDPAPIGTAAYALTPKPVDSPVAARVRESGLVMLGKTTMPDFGMLSSGLRFTDLPVALGAKIEIPRAHHRVRQLLRPRVMGRCM